MRWKNGMDQLVPDLDTINGKKYPIEHIVEHSFIKTLPNLWKDKGPGVCAEFCGVTKHIFDDQFT
jgi:hypothetical protein